MAIDTELMVIGESLLRASLVMLAALGVAWAAKKAGAGASATILALGISLAFLVTVAGVVTPRWRVEVLPPVAAVAAAEVPSAVRTRSGRPAGQDAAPRVGDDRVRAARRAGPRGEAMASTPYGLGSVGAWGWVGLVWLVGAAGQAAWLGMGLIRLRGLRARSTELRNGRWLGMARREASRQGIRREVELRWTDELRTPATFGWRRPVVLVPRVAALWEDDRVAMTLAHELCHVARRDWAVQMLARTLAALHWFHPLGWLVAARHRRACELACDELVLETGVSPSAYAQHLVETARGLGRCACVGAPALAMASPGMLEDRIVTMLEDTYEDRADRRTLTRAMVGALAALGLMSAVVQPAARAMDPERIDAHPPHVIVAQADTADRGGQRWRAAKDTKHYSMHRRSDRDGTLRELAIGDELADGALVQLEIEGAFEMLGGKRPWVRLGPGATLELDATRGNSIRRVRITGVIDGPPRRTHELNGRVVEWDGQAEDFYDAGMTYLIGLSEIAKIRGQERALHGRVRALHGQHRALQGEIRALEGQDRAFEGQLRAAEGRRRAADAAVRADRLVRENAHRAQVDALREHIHAQRDRVDAAQDRADAAQMELEELVAAMHDGLDEAVVLERRGAIESRLVEARAAYEAARELHADRGRSLEAEMAILEQRLVRERAEHGQQPPEVVEERVRREVNQEIARVEEERAGFDLDRRIDAVRQRIDELRVGQRERELEMEIAQLRTAERVAHLERRVIDPARKRLLDILGALGRAR